MRGAGGGGRNVERRGLFWSFGEGKVEGQFGKRKRLSVLYRPEVVSLSRRKRPWGTPPELGDTPNGSYMAHVFEIWNLGRRVFYRIVRNLLVTGIRRISCGDVLDKWNYCPYNYRMLNLGVEITVSVELH